MRIRIEYLSITSTQIQWYVFDTEHFTKLIQIRTEPLRNKQVFIDQINLESAIFILIYLFS